MADNYQLPIDGNWNTEDMIAVSKLIDAILQVYENGCPKEVLLANYQDFLDVMPAKAEQKRFDRDFEAQTGRSIYQTMKLARESEKKVIRLA
ncbi:UPF0223 family protein [Fructobacillus sp. M1-13]|uniref:Uncharacterized protein n=1 Tax=Fructobacillus papyriferae TaxID=2713171 RepID=A0ABS5QQE7_9LACO|nr:UPF0223 family protein [Fructobacillus papyriferae]MBS9334621.1 hypothetical protein [Fructobacillus papyriferae]MCD2158611.1 UPF0223 family protein [Fructobacillus papyriferae]